MRVMTRMVTRLFRTRTRTWLGGADFPMEMSENSEPQRPCDYLSNINWTFGLSFEHRSWWNEPNEKPRLELMLSVSFPGWRVADKARIDVEDGRQPRRNGPLVSWSEFHTPLVNEMHLVNTAGKGTADAAATRERGPWVAGTTVTRGLCASKTAGTAAMRGWWHSGQRQADTRGPYTAKWQLKKKEAATSDKRMITASKLLTGGARPSCIVRVHLGDL